MGAFGASTLVIARIASEPANAKPTYSQGMVIPGLASLNETVNFASASQYGDNYERESINEFVSCTIPIEVNDLTLEQYAYITGATVVDNVLHDSDLDTAPVLGVAAIQTVIRNAVKYYRVHAYYKVKPAKPNAAITTKTNSITIANASIPATAYRCNDGDWRTVKEFTDEASAVNYAKSLLGVGTFYSINVAKTGSGTVSPLGQTVVAAEGSFTVNASGSPTVYDNGATVSLTSGKYTISSVSGDHDIVVVYTA